MKTSILLILFMLVNFSFPSFARETSTKKPAAATVVPAQNPADEDDSKTEAVSSVAYDSTCPRCTMQRLYGHKWTDLPLDVQNRLVDQLLATGKIPQLPSAGHSDSIN
jgi:hypothetical protein